MNFVENNFIEIENSVRDQKHDIFTIFDFAKKHRNKFVARNIMFRTLFQIYIRFVQKNQCISMINNLKNAWKLNFHRRRIKIQFFSRNLNVSKQIEEFKTINASNKTIFENVQTSFSSLKFFRRRMFHWILCQFIQNEMLRIILQKYVQIFFCSSRNCRMKR